MRLRVVELLSGDKTCYRTERKYFGLFWRNPLNINAEITGIFHTRDEAERALRHYYDKPKVINTYDI